MLIVLFLVYILMAVTIGTHCADYVLWAITGQDITFLADMLLALFFSSFIIPASILLCVAGLCGVAYPLIQAAS